MSDNDLTVGVLGGMGPAATNHFFELVVGETNAEYDQDHLRIVIDNNPKIPDRTEYILDDGRDPLPKMLETAENVEQLGADILTIPCNTSHVFIDKIRATVDIKVLDMIELTIDELESNTNIEDVGLLATTGTIESRIYQNRARDSNIDIRLPDGTGQEMVMSAIYSDVGIKAGHHHEPKEILLEAIESNFTNIDGLVTGCTEISLVLSDDEIDIPIVDPLKILARDVVDRARNGYI